MPDLPATLGPFRVDAVTSRVAAGTTCAAHDEQGRGVTLVVLATDASTDPASRDRFAAAVADAAREPGEVLLDASADRRPWVALPEGSVRGGPLLEAVLPPGALAAAVRGPGFEPHWRGARELPPPPTRPEPAPDGERRPTSWWVVGAVVAAAVMVLAGFLGWRVLALGVDGAGPRAAPDPVATLPAPQPAPQPAPTPAPAPTVPPTAPPGSAPGQPPGSAPAPTAPDGGPGSRPLETTGPGVAGPSFTPEDETVEMNLDSLPFSFRVPSTWECVRDEGATDPVVRYVCTDAAVAVDPPGGVVELRPCWSPCNDEQWASLRRSYAALLAWRPVDARTAVVEDLPVQQPGTYRIRMSRIFGAVPPDPPDTHVYVEMSGAPEHVPALQKVVNDIRANTE